MLFIFKISFPATTANRSSRGIKFLPCLPVCILKGRLDVLKRIKYNLYVFGRIFKYCSYSKEILKCLYISRTVLALTDLNQSVIKRSKTLSLKTRMKLLTLTDWYDAKTFNNPYESINDLTFWTQFDKPFQNIV